MKKFDPFKSYKKTVRTFKKTVRTFRGEKREHLVTCASCGRRFDFSLGGNYDSGSRRYYCPSCVRKWKRAVRAQEREAQAEAVIEEIRQAAAEERRQKEPWLCPSCGAPTKGGACEYCGTRRP